MMKKIVDVIKLGESVGRKLSDNATETDKRRISDWDETASDKEKVLEKLSDPDYIQEKTLYYKSFDIAGAWKRAKVRKLAQQKSMHSKMRKLVWWLRKWNSSSKSRKTSQFSRRIRNYNRLPFR